MRRRGRPETSSPGPTQGFSTTKDIPVPDDVLFIERTVYESELPLEYAQWCAHLGLQGEGADAAQSVLRGGSEHGKIVAARWDNAPYHGARYGVVSSRSNQRPYHFIHAFIEDLN